MIPLCLFWLIAFSSLFLERSIGVCAGQDHFHDGVIFFNQEMYDISAECFRRAAIENGNSFEPAVYATAK